MAKIDDPFLLAQLDSGRENTSLKDDILRYGAKDPLSGLGKFGHKLLNIPSNAASLAGQKDLSNKLAFKPGYDYRKAVGLPEEENIADMLIGLAPEFLASMGIPGVNLGKAGQIISKIPKGGQYAKRALSEGLSQAGLAGALNQPENAAQSAGIAGTTQIPFSLGAQFLESPLPAMQRIGAAILGTGGGLLGGYAAHEMGAPNWLSAGIGTGLGFLGNRVAGTKGMMMEELARGKNNPLAKERLEAAERIGLDFLTPSEAYNSPFLGRKQGQLGRTEEGSELLYDLFQNRAESEAASIDRTLNMIHNPETMGPEATRLYDEAYKASVDPKFIQKYNDNNIVKAAIKDVLKEPAYQESLKNVAVDSLEFWDLVKQAMDDMAESSPNKQSRIIKNTQKSMISEMDAISPQYKEARALEERKFARRDLEKAFDKTNINSGFAFYKSLRSKEEFDKILKHLRNVPEAQQNLKDMRELFKDFRDVSTVKRVTGLEQVGMKQERNTINKLVNIFENMFTKGKFDKEAINFITSKDWNKQLEEINKISDKRKRMAKAVEVFGRGVSQATVAENEPFIKTENYEFYE